MTFDDDDEDDADDKEKVEVGDDEIVEDADHVADDSMPNDGYSFIRKRAQNGFASYGLTNVGGHCSQ